LAKTNNPSGQRAKGVRETLREVIDGDHPRYGRPFEIFVYTLIFVSLISLAVETLPGLPDGWRVVLRWEEIVVVSIFSLEYVLRIWTAKHPARYVFSFWGFIDLIAIAPFYLGLGADGRSFRSLRLLRVLRTMKLLRYHSAAERFRKTFFKIREELAIFGGLALITLFLSSVGIYYFEHDSQPEVFASIPHSLWWAAVTLTTVGYGDVYPVTLGGRVFTFFVLIIGLGIVAVPTGLFASALTEVRREEKEKREERARSAQLDRKDDQTTISTSERNPRRTSNGRRVRKTRPRKSA
jgi:voltage-gated potassium channel